MPTISVDGSFTLINVFDVDEENVDELIARLKEVTETTMQFLPGFVSTSVHRGLDGVSVANYAQWATQKDFRAIFENSAVQAHFDEVGQLAKKITPHLYRVEYARERGQAI